MLIVIPAYEPDQKLLNLLDTIWAAHPAQPVLIVDDGSGPRYVEVFGEAERRGAVVAHHSVNRGKGAALKTAFAYAEANFPGQTVVCADCDGQHRYPDICRVAEEVQRHDLTIVLGARDFAGDVPARSKIGNNATRRLFQLATGVTLADTQTGLRGYPAELLPWLQGIPGERFEFELSALLAAKEAGVAIVETPAETVYIDHNESSHFRPVVDSARVYAPLLRFMLSSIGAFVVDFVGLIVLMAETNNLFVSVVSARLLSASVNFLTNRVYVFRSGKSAPIRASAVRYAALVLAILAANYALMRLTVQDIGLPLLVGKALTETVLFAVSYQAQRRWIFRTRVPLNETRVGETSFAAQVDFSLSHQLVDLHSPHRRLKPRP